MEYIYKTLIMKNSKIILSVILVSTLLFASFSGCKKGCKPGTGGDLTFRIYPQHHGANIPNRAAYLDTVYIKFNASDFPGINPSSYNIVAAGKAGEDFITIPSMHCGQYFIYATGQDTTINQRVVGGIPIDIGETSGTKTIYVPVTE
jgi:hypothetical protein